MQGIPMPRPKFDPTYKAPKAIKEDAPHRLSGGRWTAMASLYLRTHPMCAVCGHLAHEVHHILSRRYRPDLMYVWDNLQGLCKECHREHHDQEHRRGG
jgi:5-methylcytosine-specific restriction endonuclease McrA